LLVYKIISKNISLNEKRKLKDKLRADDPEFKQKLFARIYANCRLKVGTKIRIINTSRTGVVTKIYSLYDEVKWVDHKPHFVEVLMDDGEVYIASPYGITTKIVN
jgi:hypothetical protein